MPIERRQIRDREEWKAWRREDVATASTVGALNGSHPYCTALRLYMQARGVEFNEADNRAMRRGRWLEPAIKKAVEELRPDWQIETADVYLRDPILKLGATPDFFIRGDPRGLGILQGKTTTTDILARDWDNGRTIPEWIRRQTLTEQFLADTAFAAVAVLTSDFYDMDCKIIEVPADLATIADIVARVKKLRDDVAAGREPEPDFEKDAELINLKFPHEVPDTARDLSGNNELPELLARRAEIKDRMKHEEAACKVIETELKYLLGDAEAIVGIPGWRITYKTEHHKGYTVEPSDPRVLRVYDRREKEAR